MGRIAKFFTSWRIIAVIVLVALILVGRSWLEGHPEHNPWAPLDLRDPVGWATTSKLQALREDVPACRAVLERSAVAYTALEPQGEGACLREDRTQLGSYPLSPDTPPTTCPVAVALELWKRNALDPAAQEIFGSQIEQVNHIGVYSCRRMYGSESAPWSEHATGNAIDIAGFTLADGTQINILRDWEGDDEKARFLRRIRDDACDAFATVLSPDYNAAHRDHLHFDMDARWRSVCR